MGRAATQFQIGNHRHSDKLACNGPAQIVEPRTRRWMPSIAVEGGKFFMMYRKGKQDIVVALAPPTPDGLTIHAKAALMNSNSWTFPALAGTTLYVRDRKTIAAVDLKASGE